jgi:hypothetical protein
LRKALEGVRRVFLYAPEHVDDVIRVLEKAELERVVQLSSGSVLLESAAGNAIAEEHRVVEEAFLRPSQSRLSPMRSISRRRRGCSPEVSCSRKRNVSRSSSRRSLIFLRNAVDGGSPATGVVREVLGRAPLSYRQWVIDHFAQA